MSRTNKHFRKILHWGLWWLLATAASSHANEQATQLKTLTLSTVQVHENQDLNQHAGIGLLRQALANLGYSLRIVSAPSERSLRLASAGQVDGELLRIRDMTFEYPQLRLVNEAIVTSKVFLVTRKQSAPANRRWRQLDAQQLITVQDVYVSELMPSKFRQLPLLNAPNYRTALKMLSAHRGDALLIPELYLPLVEAIPEIGWRENFVLLRPAVFELSGFVHLHFRHHQLVLPLAEEIKRLKAQAH
ncbi:hypothetical protein L1F30_16285 [Simiduia sp. 21SJ11W-1]|uniref:hypothetical protein n=1 Tax=Simiduia sp. 21SJ11W-1 TaxID=2909669 RepID=UPI0020A1131E|nr:hypothetical protein [Simiduia sp. 21SJ11W-1]UTA47701.1 hypothetical protein L1F30_16285 [Simiduia sp. 21SJ11W-1]